MPSGSGVRNYSNVFPATTVVGTIPASTPGASEVYTVNSVSGLPVAPFTGAFNRGQADEEAVLVTAVNAGTKALTLTRGYDGTAANAHSNATQAVAFEHVVVALDWREANAHINNSSVSGAHGTVVQADVANGYVDLSSAQSIAGTKTFTTDVQTDDGTGARSMPRGTVWMWEAPSNSAAIGTAETVVYDISPGGPTLISGRKYRFRLRIRYQPTAASATADMTARIVIGNIAVNSTLPALNQVPSTTQPVTVLYLNTPNAQTSGTYNTEATSPDLVAGTDIPAGSIPIVVSIKAGAGTLTLIGGSAPDSITFITVEDVGA